MTKKLKTIALYLALFLNTGVLEAQTRILLATNSIKFNSYVTYKDTIFRILPKYKSLREVDNKSVENMMASILCESSQEWVNFNTLGGTKKAMIKKAEDFQKIKNRDNAKTHMGICSKMDFDILGQSVSILKFKLFIEQAPQGVTGAYQLQKVGNRWYKTSRTDLSNIALMMMFIKPHVFSDLLAGKPKNQKEFDALLTKVYENKGLNFEKLYNEFSLWENDKEKTALFTEPAW